VIDEERELETRLRRYGSALRAGTHVTPALHREIVARALSRGPAPLRLLHQLGAVAAILLLAVVAAVVVVQVRAMQLAKAAPSVLSVVPPEGARDVPVTGEFRVEFSSRPASEPRLTLEPPGGIQQAVRWSGNTLVVRYMGLRPSTRYELALAVEYPVAIGPSGHFQRRWSFSTEPGPPPAGVAAVWYEIPSPSPGPTRLAAVDWRGNRVGTLYAPGGARQSPDGSRLLFPEVGILDQAGRSVVDLSGRKGGPVFADDSRHLCDLLDANGGSSFQGETVTWLFMGAMGSPLHRVAQAGHVGAQSVSRIAACSAAADRAVIVQYGPILAQEVWVFRLSTGALLYHHAYGSADPTASVVASRDGLLLAEQGVRDDNQGRLIYTETVIRRTSDGLIAGRIAGESVAAFSWDGNRVIATPAAGSASANEVRLYDWGSGAVLWRLPVQAAPGGWTAAALAQPGGSGMVVAVDVPDATGALSSDALWLVSETGASRRVASGPLSPSF
jgi:hypothetical protein